MAAPPKTPLAGGTSLPALAASRDECPAPERPPRDADLREALPELLVLPLLLVRLLTEAEDDLLDAERAAARAAACWACRISRFMRCSGWRPG